MLFERIALESGETVIKIVRRHWFILAVELLAVLLMAAVPFLGFVAFALVPNLLPQFDLSGLAGQLVGFTVIGVSAWFLLTVITAYMIWTHYYLDVWVITDRRIVMIDQVRFFDRRVSSFRLERLQDLSVVMSGVIETFLNFGSIRAQTAATRDDHFRMSGLPEPRELLALIQAATDRRLASGKEIA